MDPQKEEQKQKDKIGLEGKINPGKPVHSHQV